MTTLTRYFDPFANHLSRFFWDEPEGDTWLPRLDISEDDRSYTVEIDTPGINKDDLKISLENKVLVISGEKKGEEKKESRNFHRIERSYGSFFRKIYLEKDTDPDKIEAELSNGVLKISIPKEEKFLPKPIEIKVA